MKNLLRRIKENLIASKLDLSIFISCILVAGLCITLLAIVLSRDLSVDNEVVVYETASPTDAPTIPETTTMEPAGGSEETTYIYDVFEDGTQVAVPEKLQAEISCVNNWTSGGDTCVQYDINLTNVTDHVISSWELVISFDGTASVSDSWGGTFTSYGHRLDVKPEAYTEELQPGETKKLGVILTGENFVKAVTCSIKTEGISQVILLHGIS